MLAPSEREATIGTAIFVWLPGYPAIENAYAASHLPGATCVAALVNPGGHAYPLEATEFITGCGLANPYSGVPTGPENSGPSAVSTEYTYWPSEKVETTLFASTNPLFWDGDKPLIGPNSDVAP